MSCCERQNSVFEEIKKKKYVPYGKTYSSLNFFLRKSSKKFRFRNITRAFYKNLLLISKEWSSELMGSERKFFRFCLSHPWTGRSFWFLGRGRCRGGCRGGIRFRGSSLRFRLFSLLPGFWRLRSVSIQRF